MRTFLEGVVVFIGVAVLCVAVSVCMVCLICKIEDYIKNRRNKK